MSRPPDIVFESYDPNAKEIFQAGRYRTVIGVRRPDRTVASLMLLPRQRVVIPTAYQFVLPLRSYSQLPPLPPDAGGSVTWPDLSPVRWPDNSFVYWPS